MLTGFSSGGYVISAIFICAEYQRLGIHYRQHRILRISFWIKLIFILIEVALAIAFAACTFLGGSVKNAAAVIEWTIAFIFTFYVMSFFIDLLPAVRTKNHVPQGEMTNVGQRMDAGENPHDAYEENLTGDSAGQYPVNGREDGRFFPADGRNGTAAHKQRRGMHF